jgi:CheY-like chemotaxis protein
MSVQKNSTKIEDSSTVMSILVVEDDEDLGQFIVQAIHDETPYQALLATDGFQALKITTTLKPTLFLLDYNLPDMNGLELYDKLHSMEALKNVPAIFMSARRPTEIVKKHDVIFLSKPFELDALLKTIDRVANSNENG